MTTKTDVENCLKGWVDPNLGTDLVTARMIRHIGVEGDTVAIQVALGYPAAGFHEVIREALTRKVREETGAGEVRVEVDQKIVSHAVQKNLKPLSGVRNIIAVASGKGGVGKSTTAINLAAALTGEGARVGVLDADIYGPSLPHMLGLMGRPEVREGNRIVPMQAFGLQAMSIGFLVDDDQPMIWRGPMVTGALQQLLNNTDWDDLDYLIIDLPPGTGDIQLTLSQQIPVSGAIIVTTPQDIALLDARKGIRMFEKVGVPILGIVENMSVHICSQCGHAESIFGEGGGESLGADFQVPLLGKLPLDLRIRQGLDAGQPIVAADPESPISQQYRDIALRVAGAIAARARDMSHKFPKIVVE